MAIVHETDGRLDIYFERGQIIAIKITTETKKILVDTFEWKDGQQTGKMERNNNSYDVKVMTVTDWKESG